MRVGFVCSWHTPAFFCISLATVVSQCCQRLGTLQAAATRLEPRISAHYVDPNKQDAVGSTTRIYLCHSWVPLYILRVLKFNKEYRFKVSKLSQP